MGIYGVVDKDILSHEDDDAEEEEEEEEEDVEEEDFFFEVFVTTLNSVVTIGIVSIDNFIS
jgi:hypothetical protein